MNVSDAMTKQLVVCLESDTAQSVAALMKKDDIGAVPVVPDLASSTRVGLLMTRYPITCFRNDDAQVRWDGDAILNLILSFVQKESTMKIAKATWFIFILLLLGAVLAGPVRADRWNKKTIITLNQPMEVPGNKVLPPGKYVFKLVNSDSFRHVVQIWNGEETELITTLLAIPNYRMEPTGEPVIEFHEEPGTQPQALRAWFFPGDNYGQAFAYPKKRAIQLAEASKEAVPAETAEPTVDNLKSVPLVAISPGQKEEPIAQAIQTTPLPPETASQPPMVAKARELPKTASPIPLVGLLGLVFLGLAFGLRVLAKRPS